VAPRAELRAPADDRSSQLPLSDSWISRHSRIKAASRRLLRSSGRPPRSGCLSKKSSSATRARRVGLRSGAASASMTAAMTAGSSPVSAAASSSAAR
jgi:hypothetical protein